MAELISHSFDLRQVVLGLDELDLELFPSSHFFVVLLHRVPQAYAVQIRFLDVFEVDVDEGNLNGQAGPLTALEHLQQVVDVVNDTGGQHEGLVEDLRKPQSSFV